MDYTAAEYTDMLILYGECVQSARATSIAYSVRYPDRRQPNKNVILRLVHRSRETGNLVPNRNDGNAIGGQINARVPAREEMVLDAIANDPTLGIRAVARMCETSYSTAQRILSDNALHAFHYTRVQKLEPGDYPLRLDFCRWLVRQDLQDPNFTRNIIFTDESTFGREGTFNAHNYHVWDAENPHVIMPRGYQNRFSVNLWAGIKDNHLIGPIELPRRLNGHNYEGFLEHDLPELLGNAGVLIDANTWYQHDGAPAHFAVRARNVLNREFPNAWIGRGGPVAWPARSPDLTVLDYFLWGHIKEHVYRHPVNTVEELRDAIDEALATVTPEMLDRAQGNLIRRANLCIEMHGGHFEHLLKDQPADDV